MRYTGLFLLAYLTLQNVKSISCPEGAYYLNATIVDFSATLLEDAYIAFQFLMTGGFDNESFMRSLIFTAIDFSIQRVDVLS